MNIEDMIMNGANEEEVLAALNAIKEKKAAKDEAERKAAAAKEDKADKEALKTEGRAYLINASLAYMQAFDLLDAEDIDQDLVNELEEVIKYVESIAPLYIKMMALEEKMKKMDPDELGKMLGGMLG